MTDKTRIAGVDLSKGEVKAAQKEGALDHVREATAQGIAADSGTQGVLSDAARFAVSPSLNTTFIAPLLDLGADELTRRLSDGKATDFIDFEHAKGLMALERSGKNRTSYVKLLCKAIGCDSPYQVTSAGPAFTNDDTAVTAL